MNIVQIGCNDCSDHLLEYVRDHHSEINNLILVDPNKTRILNCYKVYESFDDINLHIVDKAINAKDEQYLTLYYSPLETNGHHTSTKKQHLLDHHHRPENIVAEQFPSVTFNNLLDHYSINIVDRLYVDTEGYDIDILRSIDYSKFKIKYIQFESTHSDGAFSGRTKKLANFMNELRELGYSFMNSPFGEVIAVLSKL